MKLPIPGGSGPRQILSTGKSQRQGSDTLTLGHSRAGGSPALTNTRQIKNSCPLSSEVPTQTTTQDQHMEPFLLSSSMNYRVELSMDLYKELSTFNVHVQQFKLILFLLLLN